MGPNRVPRRAHSLELIRRGLDAGAVPMVANSQITRDAERAKVGLALLDLPQPGGCDLESVDHPAREAGRRRGVPVGDAEAPRRGANVRLAPPELRQRGANAALVRGPKAGPVLAEIVSIGAIDDCIETVGPSH